HVEIAIYSRIETFATEVGDRDTAQLARRIRREEERMAKYLAAELPRLVKELVKADVPADQRRKPARATRKPASATRKAASATRKPASTTRKATTAAAARKPARTKPASSRTGSSRAKA